MGPVSITGQTGIQDVFGIQGAIAASVARRPSTDSQQGDRRPSTDAQQGNRGVSTGSQQAQDTYEASILGYMRDLSFCYITRAAVVGIVYWPSNPRHEMIYTTGGGGGQYPWLYA